MNYLSVDRLLARISQNYERLDEELAQLEAALPAPEARPPRQRAADDAEVDPPVASARPRKPR
ncbi:hypothetical protein [Lignipirellula cremea]|uniref:Uncharacterized protein n=1 Tax=Lignipirellula cremea TaxID=2528010 RepID=A0A518E4S3_9BACT|nr:hypothetical protein [Lignipirellula cremea]QDU99082.1 hypothetical protein Pla8534_69930 [Lignipirellula cremea]